MSEHVTTTELLERVRKLAPVVLANQNEGDRERRLADATVDAIRDADLYRMLVPRSLGGMQVDPLTHFRVIEELSRIDGSAGWCLFINSGSPITVSHVSDEAAETILASERGFLSGTVFPFGRATPCDGGYRVSGRWQYASGCWHSDWHLVFCNVYDEGMDTPRPGFGPMPAVVVAHVPRSEVEILDTWHVSGLVATGSHDVQIRECFVPEGYVWQVRPGSPLGRHFDAPLYRMPFASAFSWPMAAVALGIAQGAIDDVRGQAQEKMQRLAAAKLRDDVLFQSDLARVVALVGSARAYLYERIGDIYSRVERGEEVGLEPRALGLVAATNATRSAAAAVEIAYTAGGGSANFLANPLQRRLRDVHGVTQHVGTAPAQFGTAGRMLVGLPPELPLLLI